MYTYILYTKLFSPRVMFALLHMQVVSPCLEFDQALLYLKRYNLKHWNSPRFIFARWRPGENKTGRIFICIIYMYIGGFQIPSHRMINRLLLYFSPHYDCVMKEAWNPSDISIKCSENRYNSIQSWSWPLEWTEKNVYHFSD